MSIVTDNLRTTYGYGPNASSEDIWEDYKRAYVCLGPQK
jgi:hypothetical protein